MTKMAHQKSIEEISSEQLKGQKGNDLKDVGKLKDFTNEEKESRIKQLIEIFNEKDRKQAVKLNDQHTNDKPAKTKGIRNVPNAKEIINGDFNIVLDYLKKNCTKVDAGLEQRGKPFKKVVITLPKINGFNGNELKFFVETGDGCCNGKKFKENNCDKYSFSRKDIKNILNNIKKFLLSVGVNPYEKIDTFDDKYEIDRAGVCLKQLLGLQENRGFWEKNGIYRLKDKLFGLSPDYYQLVSKKDGLEFERGLYDYGDGGQNDVGQLLLKSLLNEKEN